MRFSKKTQYGLRAMIYLARCYFKNKTCSLREISEDENIPFDFLEKIILRLKKANLIGARKGSRGGYFLIKNPEKIKISEIIKILEGTISPVLCVANEKEIAIFCPQKNKCLAKNLWKKIEMVLNSTLNSITLADLFNKNF
ncbi:MAG: RrF2 family transcriptional regulator [Minisyncoccia bacterium]